MDGMRPACDAAQGGMLLLGCKFALGMWETQHGGSSRTWLSRLWLIGHWLITSWLIRPQLVGHWLITTQQIRNATTLSNTLPCQMRCCKGVG